VIVEGTGRGTITDARGRFRLDGVTGSEVTLQVQMIGFQRASQTVAVGRADVTFSLQQSAIELDQIVVTGTAGGSRQREVGNAVARVEAAQITEVALRHRTNVTGMVEHVNAVRATYGIPAYAAPAGATEERLLLDLLEERRREFFFEGRRYVDMMRYDRAYPGAHSGPGNAWDFFPRERGFTDRNVPYGPATCFPLSRTEKINNPNLSWP
jgi:hypothetical protein